MSIKIIPAGPEDSEELITIGMRAFANDVFSKATFDHENAPPEQVAEWKKWRIGLTRLRMTGPGRHYFKAKDQESGQVVGYVGLLGPDIEPPPHSAVPRPTFMNLELDNELDEKLKSTRDKYLTGRKDVWYVQTMFVDPAFQGRGIAKKLLSHALKAADEVGQDVYLEGTAAGQPLYLRCGFEPLRDISMMEGQFVAKAMIRHPQKQN